MRLILKQEGDIDISPTEVDVPIDATIDHVISMLTLKYNNIDATKLVLAYRGKVLPYEQEVLKAGLTDGCEISVSFKRKSCCSLL